MQSVTAGKQSLTFVKKKKRAAFIVSVKQPKKTNSSHNVTYRNGRLESSSILDFYLLLEIDHDEKTEDCIIMRNDLLFCYYNEKALSFCTLHCTFTEEFHFCICKI